MSGFLESVDAARQRRGAALMGVLNVTSDSFYDGGRYSDVAAAIQHLSRLAEEGADIVDIGGESSRPGAAPVEPTAQIARIEPAVRAALSRGSFLVSIDTTSPEVADRMLGLGAHAINDVSCLADADLARVAARHGAALIIMHSRGYNGAMAGFSQYPDDGYRDVIEDTLAEWEAARDRAVAAGVAAEDVLLDPGIGFSKNARQSFEVIRHLQAFLRTGARIVVGPSRKSFIAAVDASAPDARLGGTVAACLACAERGASVLRVHDVREVRQALAVASAADPTREWREVPNA